MTRKPRSSSSSLLRKKGLACSPSEAEALRFDLRGQNYEGNCSVAATMDNNTTISDDNWTTECPENDEEGKWFLLSKTQIEQYVLSQLI